MKKIICTSAIIISFLIVGCKGMENRSTVRSLVGTWEYSVPDAPYEYQEGTVTFEKTKGNLSGYLMIGEYKTELEGVVASKDHITFYMYLEGDKISFDLALEKKSFSGIVSYSQGELDIKGNKKATP